MANGVQYLKEAEKQIRRLMEISVESSNSRSWQQYRQALESVQYAQSRIAVADAELASSLLDEKLAQSAE